MKLRTSCASDDVERRVLPGERLGACLANIRARHACGTRFDEALRRIGGGHGPGTDDPGEHLGERPRPAPDVEHAQARLDTRECGETRGQLPRVAAHEVVVAIRGDGEHPTSLVHATEARRPVHVRGRVVGLAEPERAAAKRARASRIRTAVSTATSALTAPATMSASFDVVSAPAVSPCTVTTTNSGKLAKCTARHTRFDRWRRASEVSSTASSR